jgi:hypothetical protein
VAAGLGTSLVAGAGPAECARDSAEDTFTSHFYLPLVPDPWQRLLHFDLHYWQYWIQDHTAEPAMLLSLTAAAVFLLCRHGAAGLAVVAVGLTGVATVAAHPDASQLDRLMMPVWVIGAVGFPLLAAYVLARFGGDRTALLAGTPGRRVPHGQSDVRSPCAGVDDHRSRRQRERSG